MSTELTWLVRMCGKPSVCTHLLDVVNGEGEGEGACEVGVEELLREESHGVGRVAEVVEEDH